MLCDFNIIEQDFMNNCQGRLKEFNDLQICGGSEEI